MRSPLRLLPALVALPIVTLALDARAVGTRTFDLDSLEKLSGGDLKGVSIGSDGVVRAGWTLGNAPLSGIPGNISTVFAGLALADGSVLLATSTGREAKIVKIANHLATLYADVNELAVFALAQDRNGTVYAGATSGKIYKVTQGSATVFATLPDSDSVLSLATDKNKSVLVAGTGSEGRVFKIEPSGTANLLFKSEDPFISAVAVADDGKTIYAGTTGKALLYKIEGPGKVTVLYDFPQDTVKGLAIGPHSSVLAIVNEGGEVAESPVRRMFGGGSGRTPPGPSPSASRKPGKGALYRFDDQGRPEKLMHHDEFDYMALAVDPTSGAPYVGTGAEGRVYSVDDAHVVTLVADTDERQVGAIVTAPKVLVASSDPAVVHEIVTPGDSTWTSKPLDAGLRARFGHVTARTTLHLESRTGDTQVPDDRLWDRWLPLGAGGMIQNRPGRFVQVRAKFTDARATLADVVIPFETENLRPVVLEVLAHPRAQPRGEGKEGVASSGAEAPKHDTVVKVSWKVDNLDADPLRYRVQFRREDGARTSPWRDMLKPDEVLTKTEYEWDTTALAEGKYRVRVEASDEQANPPDQVQKHALESATPVLVDNTPPFFKQGPTVTGRRLRAQVGDTIGPIVRVEMAVDGRNDWRPLGAADRLFDTADEAIDADVSSLVPPGSHVIAVRAYDAAGNSVVREADAQ